MNSTDAQKKMKWARYQFNNGNPLSVTGVILELLEYILNSIDAIKHDTTKFETKPPTATMSVIKTNDSVLQPWVMELPLRAQGTLLTGIRGCDIACKPKKHDEEPIERQLVAFLRYCVLVPADAREIGHAGAWFQSNVTKDWKQSELGHFPLHWYSHLMHCYEVVGYLHPDTVLRDKAYHIYEKLANGLHLSVETHADMINRLTEDRIAKQNVVS